MKKFFSIFLALLALETTSGAQVFVNNPDYVYGMGHTDSAAVMSLASTISVRVTSEINYTITESKGKVDEDFIKTMGLASSIDLSDATPFYCDGVYYRYINKQEYISSRYNDSELYLQQAKQLKGSNIRQELNLVLGNLYLAYHTLDTPLMRAFEGSRVLRKMENIKDTAKELYDGAMKYYGYLCFDYKRFGGYMVCLAGKYKLGEVYDFEYNCGDGWKKPFAYYCCPSYGNEQQVGLYDNTLKIDSCLLKIPSAKALYRIIYKVFEDGVYNKVAVPTEWYFSEKKISNLRFLA